MQKYLRGLRLVISFVLAVILIFLLFSHYIIPQAYSSIGRTLYDGEREHQAYLQSTKSKGVLLFGRRSQRSNMEPKDSKHYLRFEIKRDGDSLRESDADFQWGVAKQEHTSPERSFVASYIYLKMWPLELFLFTVLVLIWLAPILKHVWKRRRESSTLA
ncbi:MAG: hypothetical protein P1U86_03160 [Verrucomicrobiales bacterium]|nr:hypothetical protein [Verrucomicrobiales bacterium]